MIIQRIENLKFGIQSCNNERFSQHTSDVTAERLSSQVPRQLSGTKPHPIRNGQSIGNHSTKTCCISHKRPIPGQISLISRLFSLAFALGFLALIRGASCANCQPPRLQDGNIRLAGCQSNGCRVEIQHNNQWGTICDDGFTDREASVICRSLGASSGSQIQAFGGGSGPIWLDDVVCPNNFNGFIGNCGHQPWGSHNCVHGEDVAVCCR